MSETTLVNLIIKQAMQGPQIKQAIQGPQITKHFVYFIIHINSTANVRNIVFAGL